MVQPFLLAKSDKEIYMLPQMSNRADLIAVATGTAKNWGPALHGRTQEPRPLAARYAC